MVTPEQLRDTLGHIRYDRPLARSPLVDLALVDGELRLLGAEPSVQSRSWALQQLLTNLVTELLSDLRHDEPGLQSSPDADGEIAALRDDVRSGNKRRQALALLYSRFLSPNRLPSSRLHRSLGISERTLRSRITQGVQLLADELAKRESLISSQHAGPAGAMPTPASSFVGREGDVARVRKLLAQHRLITLTGIGGVGKSRLMIELAASVRLLYPAGVCYIDLSAVAEGDQIGFAVTSALGLSEQPDRTALETAADYIADRHQLLLLDNCEHLADSCAQLVGSLLQRCPNLQVMVTARQRLWVPDEAVVRVRGLNRPPEATPEPISPHLAMHYDAVRLLVDRADEADSHFKLSEENVRYVADICRALDGIPLAVEMAAPFLRIMSARDLAARAVSTFALDMKAPGTLRPQQQTLRSVMGWSYGLLPKTDRALLRRLSVFSGTWSLEAVQEVCAWGELSGPDIAYHVLLLSERSLVKAESPRASARCRLLQTVAAFASEQLERSPSESTETWSRYEAWFHRLAVEARTALWTSRQARWLEKLDLDYPNLKAAVDHSLAHGNPRLALEITTGLSWYWTRRGRWSEGRDLLLRALAHNGIVAAAASEPGTAGERRAPPRAAKSGERSGQQMDPATRSLAAAALQGLASLEASLGDLDSAEADSRSALRWLAEPQVNPALFSEIESHRARILMIRGEFAQALTHLRSAEQVARETESDLALALALWMRGWTLEQKGDIAASIRCHDEARVLNRSAGHLHGLAWSLCYLGVAVRRTHDIARAVRLLTESKGHFDALRDAHGTGTASLELSIAHRLSGDDRRADECLREAALSELLVADAFTTIQIVEAAAERARQRADQLVARHLGLAADRLRTLAGMRAPGTAEVPSRTADLTAAAGAIGPVMSFRDGLRLAIRSLDAV